MSDFLENLKKAADNEDFNSEAAKKILEVSKLADEKLRDKNVFTEINKIKENLQKREEESEEVKEMKESKPTTEEEVIELNSAYEKKMEEIKKQDLVNSQLATLIDIEDMVKASIEDMLGFVSELEDKFKKELEETDSIFNELSVKISDIKTKYKL